MPYATNRGIRIHYEVIEAREGADDGYRGADGRVLPLVIQHGFSSSAAMLRQLGYIEALGGGRRVILIDARGHGRSDKPHDASAYTLAHRVSDVIAVLDDVGAGQADFLGYSMGGWIGFGLLAWAEGRVGRAVLGGAHPLADDGWASFAGIDPADDSAFIFAFEAAIGERFGEEVKPLILDNDRVALAASARHRDSLTGALGGVGAPILLYCGSGDARRPEIERAASALPGSRLHILEGLSHAEVYMRPEVVAHVVGEFLGGGAGV